MPGFAQGYVRWHFPVASLLLLSLTLVAFGDNLFTDVHQPSNSVPRMVIHGIILLSWMLLLVAQSWLVFLRRTDLHRKLGQIAFVVAAAAVASTIWLFVAAFDGFARMSPEVIANRIFLPSFALCMVAAWHMRRRPQLHRHYVWAGNLLLLEPILARTYDPLVAPLMPVMAPGEDEPLFLGYMVIVWTGFFSALLLHDRLRDGRLHPVSLAGLGWLYAVYAFAFTVARA